MKASESPPPATPARLFRERVVLTEMRRLGQCSKTEVANQTGFPLQTVVDIVNQLEADGLVSKLGKRLGRVGQPSILYGINPDGVFALGLKVDRCRCDLLAIDFEGRIRDRWVHNYELPHLETVCGFLSGTMHDVVTQERWRGRICGLGVALSHDLWYQPARQGLPEQVIGPWRDRDVAGEFSAAITLPVFVENDTRVAAVAEYLLGAGQEFSKFLHVVIGTHISGALVLGGSLETGAHGRAATLGAIPVGPSRLAHASCGESGDNRLGARASLSGLMRHLGLHGFTIRAVSELPEVLDRARGLVQEWLDDCVEALVEGLTACFAVIDVEAVIIDSGLPQFLVMEIVDKLGRRLAAANVEHLVVPQLRLSRMGADGALVGAAILPINAHFFPSREALAAEQLNETYRLSRGRKRQRSTKT